ncbi:hypothetical protein [Chenggangzhangella methanolivorans]|uniref:Secreted protein n=1 Tax=Chenggangzhangella methanolivorans TaxID=1437009 RepID=A0A9E6UKS9_9HYPH|nr:hypothetical protein [Chenggangzhangella methanolivorans]QZN99746.1 hypothetical protein K6K41_24275 [Chenggangzhangella methanolivorans]
MRSRLKITAAYVAALLLAVSGALAQAAPNNNGKDRRPEPSAEAAPPLPVVGVPTPTPMEQVFVPVAPCRLLNTAEAGAGGAIQGLQTRTFQVTGAAGFETQGGKAGGCGVPASATSVAILLRASNASSAGFFTAFAAGTPNPGVIALAYPQTATATGNPIVGLGDGRMAIYSKRYAHAIADVVGYYAPQIAAYMDSNGTAYRATTRIVSTQRITAGFYNIVVDRDVTDCVVQATIAGGPYLASASANGNTITVQTYTLFGGNASLTSLVFYVSAQC